MSTPSSHLTVLTGASRGLGRALAEQLIDAGHELLCIARTRQPALDTRAAARGVALEQWTLDLADASAAARALSAYLQRRSSNAPTGGVCLLNNAACMPHIAPLHSMSPGEVAQSLRINLEAPMALTAAFLAATQSWPAPRKVLNMSSGLGRRAMASQAAYCAAKAAMDHFSRCVALEEAAHAHGARICSLAPGVVDTDMQTQLRAAPAADFADRDAFIDLKQRGALTSAAQAAARVLAYLERPDFGAQPVGDVRD